MNEHDRSRQPAPGLFCATYEPLLALHHTGELDPTERTSLLTHLATCERCQERLGEYATVYGALLKHFGREISAPPVLFTLDDIVRAADEEDAGVPAPVASGRDTSLPRSAWPVELPRDRPALRPFGSGWAAVAAVLLIALLAGALFRFHGAPSAGSKEVVIPTPTLDPTSEAYVSVLRTYYPPFIAAEEQEFEQCALPITHFSPPEVLAPCRPVELAAITAAQTLVDHLVATPPPARWQAQDAALKQALRAAIAYNTERIHDIDAKAVVPFYLTRTDGGAAGSLLCTTILQIDRGPPPLSPGFSLPDYARSPDNSPGCA
jgi:hypothetical protein